MTGKTTSGADSKLRQKLAKLRDEIRVHERRYYLLDDPSISDAEFDRKMQQLKALLPICPTCKKIRDEHDQWTQVETYVATHMGSVVSQRQCPHCEATRNASRQSLRAKLGQVRQDLRKNN